MAKLEWHSQGANRYELGIEHCALYLKTEGDKAYTNSEYKKGIAWNGITSVQETPDGAEPNDLWADNIKYGSLRSAETLGGTIEAYQAPDDFQDCDGTVEILTGIRVGQQHRKSFGLAYITRVGNETQSNADDGERIHIVYNCTASPSDRQYETINDSPDAITFSWEFDTIPVDISRKDAAYKNMKPLASLVINTLEAKTEAEKTRLKVLKAVLFGEDDFTDSKHPANNTVANDPILPDPDVVISILEGASGYTNAKQIAAKYVKS